MELVALTALTPGDFAVVRRNAEILDCLHEPDTKCPVMLKWAARKACTTFSPSR